MEGENKRGRGREGRKGKTKRILNGRFFKNVSINFCEFPLDFRSTSEFKLNGKIKKVFSDSRSILGELQSQEQCTACSGNSSPSPDGNRCISCNPGISGENCACIPPSQMTGGVCFNSSVQLISDSADLYKIDYDNGQSIDSWYIRENVRAAEAMCRVYN